MPIPPPQIILRANRPLAQFIATGEYFADRTFDWLRLEGTPDACRITLVRSLDEGAAHFTDVQAFAILDDEPGQDPDSFEGPLPEALAWAATRFGAKPNASRPLRDLDAQYAALVAQGRLGNNDPSTLAHGLSTRLSPKHPTAATTLLSRAPQPLPHVVLRPHLPGSTATPARPDPRRLLHAPLHRRGVRLYPSLRHRRQGRRRLPRRAVPAPPHGVPTPPAPHQLPIAFDGGGVFYAYDFGADPSAPHLIAVHAGCVGDEDEVTVVGDALAEVLAKDTGLEEEMYPGPSS